MAFDDTPVNAALTMDRATPLGSSAGSDGRARLHTKISNTAGEPVPTNDTTTQADINAFATQNHTDLTKLDTDLNSFATQNHTDVSKVDTDLLAFKLANHADLGQLDTDLLAFKTANHSDLAQIDSDVLAFKASNHTDLSQLDTDLLAFKSANHTDLGQLDMDLLAFKTANHTDLAQLDTDLLAFKSANHTDLTQLDTDLLAFKLANHTDITKVDTDLNTFASTNHTDLTKLDTDINSFAAANHTDVTKVDTDLLAFKAANHTDLAQVDTDLVAFKTANHTDLTQLDTDLNALKSSNHTDLSAINAAQTNKSQMTQVTNGTYQADIDSLGHLRTKDISDNDIYLSKISMSRMCQIQARFDLDLSNNDVATTTTGTGTATEGSGVAVLSSGTGTTASAKLASNKSIVYSPARGIYATFSASFTTPTSASSEQRIGLYDSNNGFFIGFHGTTFGITQRSGGSDTFTGQSSFNGDLLTGLAGSKFQRGGSPESLNQTLLNLYRIDWGYLGSAPIKFQVMSPDGFWVTFHTIKYPNTSTTPNVLTPSLPITSEVTKTTSDATNLQIKTASWDAGTVEDTHPYGPEAFKSRKYITTSLAAQTTSQALYTVSTGRTLNVTNLIVSFSNASVTTAGQLNITDGSGGTLRVPLTSPASTNQSSAGNNLNANFSPVALKFTNSVFATIVSGTITYSITIVGYEAEI